MPNSNITFDASTVDPIDIPGYHLHSSPVMGVVAENWLVHAALNKALAEQNLGNVTVRTGARVKTASIPKFDVSSASEVRPVFYLGMATVVTKVILS